MILLMSDITGADIVATYRTFVFVAGVVLAVWGFIKVVREITKPLDDMKKTISAHSTEIKEINEHLKKSDEGMAIVQQSLLQIMNHMIDGDHQEQLVKARDNMQTYLTKK